MPDQHVGTSDPAAAMPCAAAAAVTYPAASAPLGPSRSTQTPISGLRTAAGAAKHMTVTETAYALASNRYAANPHKTIADAQPPIEFTVSPASRRPKRRVHGSP